MEIVLDADVIIHGERRTFDLAAWLDSRPDDEFRIAAITVAELWHGVERAKGKHRDARESYLRSLIASMPVLPYLEQTALIHARLWAAMETKGRSIGAHDLILAAAALDANCAIATFNRRHFELIPGLNLIEPHVE